MLLTGFEAVFMDPLALDCFLPPLNLRRLRRTKRIRLTIFISLPVLFSVTQGFGIPSFLFSFALLWKHTTARVARCGSALADVIANCVYYHYLC